MAKKTKTNDNKEDLIISCELSSDILCILHPFFAKPQNLIIFQIYNDNILLSENDEKNYIFIQSRITKENFHSFNPSFEISSESPLKFGLENEIFDKMTKEFKLRQRAKNSKNIRFEFFKKFLRIRSDKQLDFEYKDLPSIIPNDENLPKDYLGSVDLFTEEFFHIIELAYKKINNVDFTLTSRNNLTLSGWFKGNQYKDITIENGYNLDETHYYEGNSKHLTIPQPFYIIKNRCKEQHGILKTTISTLLLYFPDITLSMIKSLLSEYVQINLEDGIPMKLVFPIKNYNIIIEYYIAPMSEEEI